MIPLFAITIGYAIGAVIVGAVVLLALYGLFILARRLITRGIMHLGVGEGTQRFLAFIRDDALPLVGLFLGLAAGALLLGLVGHMAISLVRVLLAITGSA